MGRDGFDNEHAETVLVVDAEKQFVEYVSAATARRALRDGCVRVFRKQPFSIQLPPGVNRCPRTFARARRARKTGIKMATNSLRSFTDLFREEKDVWVKSTIPGQVSIQFKPANGDPIGILVPFSGDPVCLTDRVPFDAIKNSTDLRTLCNPRKTRSGGFKPAALRLMSSEEVQDHFAKKARRHNLFVKDAMGNDVKDPDTGERIPDIEAASQPRITEPATTASAARVEGVGSLKSEAAMEAHSDVANLGKDGKVMMSEAIHPRVLHTVNQITTAENDAQRPLAGDLLDEFEALAGELNEESLLHIQAMGYYKTVKKWASEMLAARSQSEAEA